MFEISKINDIESLKIKKAKNLEKKKEKEKKSGRNKERKKFPLQDYYNKEVNKEKLQQIRTQKKEKKRRREEDNVCPYGFEWRARQSAPK